MVCVLSLTGWPCICVSSYVYVVIAVTGTVFFLVKLVTFPTTGEGSTAYGLGSKPNGTTSGNMAERALQPAVIPDSYHAGESLHGQHPKRSYAEYSTLSHFPKPIGAELSYSREAPH